LGHAATKFTRTHLLFTQLNHTVNPFQRSFVGEIRRIEEMARRVRFFAAQIAMEKDVISIRPFNECAPLTAHSLDELDVTLSEHETRLLQMNESYQTLNDRTREFIEARHVLRETAVFFDKVRCAWEGTGLFPPLCCV
jgi:V-type H+-transporting ATPase subunit a